RHCRQFRPERNVLSMDAEGTDFRMTHRIAIRALRLFLLAMAMANLTILPARAVLEIDVNKGTIEPLPIAITDFLSGDGLGAEIAAVISADLRRSGLFQPIQKEAFIEKISNPDVAPRFD